MKNTGTRHRNGQTGSLINTEWTRKLDDIVQAQKIESNTLHSLNQANEVQWLTLGW